MNNGTWSHIKFVAAATRLGPDLRLHRQLIGARQAASNKVRMDPVGGRRQEGIRPRNSHKEYACQEVSAGQYMQFQRKDPGQIPAQRTSSDFKLFAGRLGNERRCCRIKKSQSSQRNLRSVKLHSTSRTCISSFADGSAQHKHFTA